MIKFVAPKYVLPWSRVEYERDYVMINFVAPKYVVPWCRVEY
jgi:hypothetical protein